MWSKWSDDCVFSCHGISIPTLATSECGHKEWLLRLQTLHTLTSGRKKKTKDKWMKIQKYIKAPTPLKSECQDFKVSRNSNLDHFIFSHHICILCLTRCGISPFSVKKFRLTFWENLVLEGPEQNFPWLEFLNPSLIKYFQLRWTPSSRNAHKPRKGGRDQRLNQT